MSLLELEDVRKVYRDPSEPGVEARDQLVLDVPSFALEAQEEVALAGASGSGKTTLLHVIAGILRPDSGAVRLETATGPVDLARLSEAQRDRVRARAIGIVFQTFELLPAFSALENVLFGMAFGAGMDRARAKQLLGRLGMGERLHHRPGQLSIGQRQRVAIARALAHRPRLVLADEPTGSLDPARAAEALALLREACREEGAALVVVTHDRAVFDAFPRRIELEELNRAAASRGAKELAALAARDVGLDSEPGPNEGERTT